MIKHVMASGFNLIVCTRLIAHNMCFILDCHSFSANAFEIPRRLLNVRCVDHILNLCFTCDVLYIHVVCAFVFCFIFLFIIFLYLYY
jgi:hypothetical protein